MKNILLIVAALLTLGASYLSYSNNQKLGNINEEAEELAARKENLAKSVDEAEEELAEANAAVKEAEALIAGKKADLDIAKSKINSLKKSQSKFEDNLATIDSDIEDLGKLESEVQNTLAEFGMNDISELPDKISSLKKDIRDEEDNLSNINIVTEELETSIAAKESEKDSITSRIASIKKTISNNSLVGRITAVNSDWGFVVINKGSVNSSLGENQELLVSRGGRYIGKVTVSTLEENQSICDITPTTLKYGTKVFPGDLVILKDTVAR